MVAAMRKGDMSAEEEIVKANKSRRAVETRIKISSSGIALFIAFTECCWGPVLFKSVLVKVS